MWQYSSTGSVSGIAGNVDMNKWNGTMTQLLAYVAPPPVADAGVKADAGTVKVDAGTIKPDAGAADAGTKADGGVKSDAGTASDAGAIADAGTIADAGMPDFDAGAEPEDAGSEEVPDAGEEPVFSSDGGEGAVLGSGRTGFIESCTGDGH
jgi:hypothetical protein